MKIAVNAGSLSKNNYDLFLTLAKAHLTENFVFIFNNETSISLPENVTRIIVKSDYQLQQNAWNTLKIKRILNREKPDVFISEKSVFLKSNFQQILVSPELSYLFLQDKKAKKYNLFYKKNNCVFFERSDKIIVGSNFLKQEIRKKFETPAEKIEVIYPDAASFNFRIPEQEERENIKEKYAAGNEYFVYKGAIGSDENLVNLLKAFSFFKKRQRSKMQLILMGYRATGYESFLDSFRLFRFKNDVKILPDVSIEEAEKILKCAYAMVFVPLCKADPSEIVSAMRCEIPLIVSSSAILKEYCEDAALYANASDFNDIAAQMMLLFKDEQKRKELIEKGRSSLQKFFTHDRQELLWQTITNVVGKNQA